MKFTDIDLLKMYKIIYGFIKTLQDGGTVFYQIGENLGRALGLSINITGFGFRRK